MLPVFHHTKRLGQEQSQSMLGPIFGTKYLFLNVFLMGWLRGPSIIGLASTRAGCYEYHIIYNKIWVKKTIIAPSCNFLDKNKQLIYSHQLLLVFFSKKKTTASVLKNTQSTFISTSLFVYLFFFLRFLHFQWLNFSSQYFIFYPIGLLHFVDNILIDTIVFNFFLSYLILLFVYPSWF